jgi:hypothetical protein
MSPKAVSVLSDSDGALSSGDDAGPVSQAIPAPSTKTWSLVTAKQHLDLLISGGCGCCEDHYAAFRGRGDLVSQAAAKLLALKQRHKHDQDRAMFQELREQLLCQGVLLPSGGGDNLTLRSLRFIYLGHELCAGGMTGFFAVSTPTFRKLAKAALAGNESCPLDQRYLKGVPGNNDKGLTGQVYSYLQATCAIACARWAMVLLKCLVAQQLPAGAV